ncbi:NmrA-like family domain-containing protein 1 [Tolypocladium ophioglossoides CBS 100239]|uniref:NmrA-like family domain-containing protein 1 n=1 Tax=Tolypocladium ophioglossoides (strain CBS 100239) TaxID=1163406 RepID=A0A0L0N4T1_TOLOC|nr:NmrA-like family domain-containing protein 1 [Tolypocladium ophioglossoides CBS 100239]
MAKKLLTVVGGTGTQGLSVINAALKDGTYKVRASTRNPTSEKAEKLRARGVEVVQADVSDEQSLVKAFEGSAAIYGITDFFEPFSKHGPEKAVEIESAQGINVAKAASKTASLEHFIWSTLPNGGKLTRGKYLIPHLVAKNQVDDYIEQDKALYSKTTFLWITFYGNNFQYPMFTPNLMKSSGSYIQLSPGSPSTPILSIGSPLGNIGPFALAILRQPHKTLPGRFVLAHVEETTNGKMLQDWAEVTNKRAVFVQTSLDDFSNVWPIWGLEMGAMMEMWDELKERTWSGEDGILTKDDLGVSTENLVGFKGAVAEMDWKALL